MPHDVEDEVIEPDAQEEKARIAIEAAKIAHFNELVPVGRGNWLALLAYLGFVFVTVLAVQDSDFFVPNRNTALPLVNVTIPTRYFFIFAPVLGAALYIYLHFTIRQVVEVFLDLPETHKGQSLETFLKPWILVDHLHRVRRAESPRHMDLLAGITTILMVWLAGPFVLLFFWWRSWPAHSEWITTMIAVALIGCLYAGLSTWMLFRKVKGKSGTLISVTKTSVVVGAVILVVGFIRTDWGGAIELRENRFGLQSLLAQTDLHKANLTTQNASAWRNREAFGRELAQAACDRAGVPKHLCGVDIEDSDDPRFAVLWQRSMEWCQTKLKMNPAECEDLGDRQRFDIMEEWPRRMRELYAGSPLLDLSGVDLRRADLSEATIRNVDFTGADLSGANFARAVLENVEFEGTNLTGASFEGGELSDVRFSDANLTSADFSGARLRAMTFFGTSGALSDGTKFDQTDIRGVYFFFGGFQNASFYGADISGALLFDVTLSNTNLRDLRLKNSMLAGVEVPGADWAGAWLRRSLIADVEVGDAEIGKIQLTDLIRFDDDRLDAALANRPEPERAGIPIKIDAETEAMLENAAAAGSLVVIEEHDTPALLEDRFEMPTCWPRVPHEVKGILWWMSQTPFSHPEDYAPGVAAITCSADEPAE